MRRVVPLCLWLVVTIGSAAPVAAQGRLLASGKSFVGPDGEPPRPYDLLVAHARAALGLAIRAPSDSEKKDHARGARELAEQALALDSMGFEARYSRAAATAIELEGEGMTTKVRMAGEVWLETDELLAVDSLHAGVHHLRGRLHAGVMRLGGVARFVARRLPGGDAMLGASWEGAERHLGRAVELSPGELLYQVELARVYQDTGRRDLAVEALERVILAEPGSPMDEHQIAVARRRLDSLR